MSFKFFAFIYRIYSTQLGYISFGSHFAIEVSLIVNSNFLINQISGELIVGLNNYGLRNYYYHYYYYYCCCCCEDV